MLPGVSHFGSWPPSIVCPTVSIGPAFLILSIPGDSGAGSGLRGNSTAEPSSDIRGRVERARAVQSARGFYNAQMPSRMIRKQCELDDAGERTLEMAVRRMSLSARAHDRILKVAPTVADLGESETVSAKHVAEAAQYRSLDRNYWS